MRKIVIGTLIIVAFACSNKPYNYEIENEIVVGNNNEDAFDPDADYQLLFIGNSLTIQNNLPLLVKNIGTEMGYSISCQSITGPGYGLEDHWNIGTIQPQISSNFFDYVIIQQGPSSQAYGRESLMEYGRRIADLCDDIDTQLAFFMVWPSLQYYHTFDDVITNYTDAANINNALNCNVGELWKHYFDQNEDFSYYGSDGFHPSLSGSERSAQIIIQKLSLTQ